MKIEEVQIPAPWGHIAVKIWGADEKEVIVLIHGALDNAGSFDNLIPLLPNKFCYVCMDLPGHGLSSYIHRSVPIHTVDYMLSLRIVLDYFRRQKYILLGHGVGGQVCLFLTMLYPQRVSKLLTIDALTFQPVYPNFFVNKLLSHHEAILAAKLEESKPPPSYTYEECVNKIIDARSHGCFNRKAAEPLVKRMVRKIDDNRYIFAPDRRLRAFLSPTATHDYLIEMYEQAPIRCPFMVIMNDGFAFSMIFVRMYKYLKRKGVKINVVSGHHDTHMTDPEKMAHYINDFLFLASDEQKEKVTENPDDNVERGYIQNVLVKHEMRHKL